MHLIVVVLRQIINSYIFPTFSDVQGAKKQLLVTNKHNKEVEKRELYAQSPFSNQGPNKLENASGWILSNTFHYQTPIFSRT